MSQQKRPNTQPAAADDTQKPARRAVSGSMENAETARPVRQVLPNRVLGSKPQAPAAEE